MTNPLRAAPSLNTENLVLSTLPAVDPDTPHMAYPGFHATIQFCTHFVVPVMMITGIVGNILTFLVFVFSSLKRLSTSVYLAALALADCGFLCSLGAGWLDNFRFSFFQLEAVCMCVIYLTYVCSFMSVWLVVCFTTEMYLTLFHSDLAARVKHPNRARVVVCGLTLLCCGLYLYTFWTTKQVQTLNGRKTCAFQASEDVTMALALTDSFLTLLLPFSLIIFMNTRIVIVIAGFSRTRKGGREPRDAERTKEDEDDAEDKPLPPVEVKRGSRDGKERGPDGDSNEIDLFEALGSSQIGDFGLVLPLKKPKAKHCNISKMQRQSFKMLLTAAMVFLILNLPSHAIRLQGLLRSFITPSYVTSEEEHLLQQLFQILYYFNFMANFIIYNACTKSFRNAFTSLPIIISNACTCNNHNHDNNSNKHNSRGEGKHKESPRVPANSSRRVGEKLRRMREHQNSRLVEVNLAELQISKMESFSNFKYQSPPCLLRVSDDSVQAEQKV